MQVQPVQFALCQWAVYLRAVEYSWCLLCQIDTGKPSLCFGYFHLETEAWSQIYDADAEFEANIDADAYIFEH